ncbi:MAG: sulfite exporter TauE/SafE family protein [Pseudomonadota bacterium]
MQDFGFSVAGLVVGIAVGATGVGGGSLMTPILIMFYGINPAIAVGTDLLYASASKSFGVLLHGRNGSLDWRIVRWMALGSVPATLITLAFLHNFPKGPGLDGLIKLTLAIAIIVTATFALFQDQLMRLIKRGNQNVVVDISERKQFQLTILSGVLIGTLVTISSVGAGVIGMMLLLLIYPKHAPIRLVGSDLAHAVIITAIAGAGHASLGTVNYSLLGYLLLGALPGIWIGSKIGFNLPEKLLKRVIAGFLIFIGGTMLLKAMTTGI